MDKVEIIGIAVVVMASAVAYYSFLEQIEPLQFVSPYLVGAFTTYVVQHRLQVEAVKRRVKRENAINMRDKVYGPIFREMSKILESMEQEKRSDWEITDKLGEMRTHYLFFKMKRDLRNEFYTLVERLDEYETVHSATLTLILRQIKEVVRESYRIDLRVARGQVGLRLELIKDAIGVGSIKLEEAIMQSIDPTDFIRTRKERWGEDIFAEVRVGGLEKSIGDFESLYKTVLRNVEKESLYRKEKQQREALVIEIRAFLERIEDFAVAV